MALIKSNSKFLLLPYNACKTKRYVITLLNCLAVFIRKLLVIINIVVIFNYSKQKFELCAFL